MIQSRSSVAGAARPRASAAVVAGVMSVITSLLVAQAWAQTANETDGQACAPMVSKPLEPANVSQESLEASLKGPEGCEAESSTRGFTLFSGTIPHPAASQGIRPHTPETPKPKARVHAEPLPDYRKPADARAVSVLIQFDLGGARVNRSGPSDHAIAQVAGYLQAHPQIALDVVGHTDDSGSRALNRRLSLARAGAIKARLEELGIAPGRVFARGAGASDMIADIPPSDPRQRRVDFVIRG